MSKLTIKMTVNEQGKFCFKKLGISFHPKATLISKIYARAEYNDNKFVNKKKQLKIFNYQ